MCRLRTNCLLSYRLAQASFLACMCSWQHRSVQRITLEGNEMKKLLLATGLVIAQAASMAAFAQSNSAGMPAPTAQANGEKGTAPAGPKPDMAGTSSPGMAKGGASSAGGMAPAPTTDSTGERTRMPPVRKPATGLADTSGRPSTGDRKAAPTPSAEANGEKAKGSAPAK